MVVVLYAWKPGAHHSRPQTPERTYVCLPRGQGVVFANAISVPRAPICHGMGHLHARCHGQAEEGRPHHSRRTAICVCAAIFLFPGGTDGAWSLEYSLPWSAPSSTTDSDSKQESQLLLRLSCKIFGPHCKLKLSDTRTRKWYCPSRLVAISLLVFEGA